GGDDLIRTAILDVAGRAEKPLGRIQRGRVDTTGQDAAGCGRRVVVRAAQSGDRVEQHDDVLPCSTSRLARSIASSAAWVWSDGGRSKVEAMTSPFTERCMSVTSSGRSSTSTTIRWHSGLFLVIAFGMSCMTMV